DADLTARFEREALPLLDSLCRGALVLTGGLYVVTPSNCHAGIGGSDYWLTIRLVAFAARRLRRNARPWVNRFQLCCQGPLAAVRRLAARRAGCRSVTR